MYAKMLFRRIALFAAGVAASGALGAAASTPALAQTETPIFGSGAALQNQLQNDVLLPNDALVDSDVTFTATTSGAGFNEFGNNTGVLDPTQDTVANPVLDSYVATDSAPSTTQLATAKTAGGSNELTVPVAQTPLDLIADLPSSVKVGGTLKLTNALVSEAYGGELPAAGTYPANSWGALLLADGLSVGSTANGTTFTDTGTLKNGTGGYLQLQVEVRKNGAGTTQNLKDYEFALNSLKGSGPWASPVLDDSNAYGANEWPTGASLKPASPGNSTDAAEVSAVLANPGTLGYATAGDAASGGFTNTPQTESTTKTQNLYALVQNNGVSTSKPTYADPEANSVGDPNVYTGAVNVNGNGGGPGSWVVPLNSSGKYSVTGSWNGTVASDPNVAKDGTGAGSDYPLVAVAYDLSWLVFANLPSGSSKPSSNAGFTTQDYLEWATSVKGGQNAISTYGTAKGDDSFYYAPLPATGTGANDVQADAATSAAAVNNGQ